MRIKTRIALVSALWAFGAVQFATAEQGASASIDTTAVDRFIAMEMRGQRVPGMAVAIVRGDEVVLARGYGGAEGQALTADTRFHIASLSKGFTALAVMQLVEQGLIDLDAPVKDYIPTFTTADQVNAARITVRDLLHQTSGLADSGFPELRLPQPTSLEDRVSSLASAVPSAPPGQEFNYFNPNYGVLARLVEVVGGQSYSSYLDEHVFEPLGMRRTLNVNSTAEARDMAEDATQGYLLVFGVPLPAEEENGFLGGSGGVVSTAADMANYLVMLLNGGRFGDEAIVSPEGLEQIQTPPRDVDSPYAMGWFVSDVAGQRVLEHNGILSTYYSEAVLMPEEGFGFVLLYDVHSVGHELLAFPRFKEGLLAILTGRSPASPSFGAGSLGMVLGALTVVAAVLGIRSMWRLRRRPNTVTAAPRALQVARIAWSLVPVALFVAMPALVLAVAGRAFGYLTLARSMPSVMLWLGTGAILGAIGAVWRLALLVRSRPTSADNGR